MCVLVSRAFPSSLVRLCPILLEFQDAGLSKAQWRSVCPPLPWPGSRSCWWLLSEQSGMEPSQQNRGATTNLCQFTNFWTGHWFETATGGYHMNSLSTCWRSYSPIMGFHANHLSRRARKAEPQIATTISSDVSSFSPTKMRKSQIGYSTCPCLKIGYLKIQCSPWK